MLLHGLYLAVVPRMMSGWGRPGCGFQSFGWKTALVFFQLLLSFVLGYQETWTRLGMVLPTSRFHRKGPGPSLGDPSFLSHTLEHHKGTAPSSTFSCLLSAIRRSRLTSSPWHISCFPVCDQRNPRSHHWPSPALGRDGVSRSCPTPSHCIHT